MDSAPEEINLRDQIAEIVQFLVDIFHRVRERSEQNDLFLVKTVDITIISLLQNNFSSVHFDKLEV